MLTAAPILTLNTFREPITEGISLQAGILVRSNSVENDFTALFYFL